MIPSTTMPVLPDVLDVNLQVVFCGTAVGRVSAQIGAYYAGPGNKFWPTLYKIGLTPRLLKPQDYLSIRQYGLGLTDIAKEVSGADSILTPTDFDAVGLRTKILDYHPLNFAFNGKRAASEFYKTPTNKLLYGIQNASLGNTTMWILPSTSGAANGAWNESWWQTFADHLRQETK